MVDDAFLPLRTTRGGGPGAIAGRDGQALAVTGAEVGAVVREAGAVHVRVFNPSDETTQVRIEGRQGWLVDLRGRPRHRSRAPSSSAPGSIATAALA